ncbi:MAG: 4-alpha-glucanotransferase [Ruminococcaceae bacterium]|nr:4-alpha-glucanotransferase [Oscillospiraceae bacterium]
MQTTEREKVTLDALQKEIEAMRAEYEAKLAAIRDEKSEMARAADAQSAKFKQFLREQEAWLNEYVEVRLFKDNEKYKDDVYVAINGKNCVIRRGVWTRIRRKFALLLDQSEIQDLRTAELMEREAGRFADESRRRDV